MNRLRSLLVALGTGALVLLVSLSGRSTAGDPAPSGAALTTFVQDYCVACHSGEAPDGGLDLKRLATRPRDVAGLTVLRQIADRVRAAEMPPPDALQPDGALRVRISASLEQYVERTIPGIELDPGRVTVRRLSRVEYRNTIRDLLGIAFEPSRRFPNDDLAYGFDNIGDVLSVSPLLLEKYARAARDIAEQAIVLEDPENPEVRRIEAESMDSTLAGDGGRGPNGYNLYAAADLTTRIKLPRDGEYTLRVLALADQAGPDLARMAFLVNGRQTTVVDMTKADREPETHTVTVRLKKGENVVGVAFVNDYYRPDDPDPSERDRNLSVDWMEVVGPVDVVEFSSGHTWLRDADPGKGTPLARARAISKALLARTWRRKATTAEVKRNAGLITAAVDGGAPYLVATRLALRAALVSPHFLYRLEPGATSGKRNTARTVGDDALASRLSYFLWSSMPDARLLKLARQRKLRKPDVLAAEVRRMLKSPKAVALATNFAVQWLELRNLQSVTPDPTLFPDFDEALRVAMRREAELFFLAVLEEDRDVRELLRADFTFVNARLARHYGIAGIQGEVFQRVPLKGSQRGGLLTQAGVLTVTSNPTRTSPVKRGKWVLENILDAAPLPPPADTATLDETAVTQSAATLREQSVLHRADPVCASCHVRMDALGFSLERYDAIGAWRRDSGGQVIDATTELPDGRTIEGASALREVLGTDTAFLRCLTKKLFIFAIGRDPSPDDELAIYGVVADLQAGKPTLAGIIARITQLRAFRMRRVKE